MIDLVYNGTATIRIGDKPIEHGDTVTVSVTDAKSLRGLPTFKDAKKTPKKKAEVE